MAFVTLVSGGIDSTLMAVMAKEEGIDQYPLFIDYGQLSARLEWAACKRLFRRLRLPSPARADLRGYGRLIPSGITSRLLRTYEDAFLPGRNLLFILVGAAYAYRHNAGNVAIGLLDEKSRLFPDQSSDFLSKAVEALGIALGRGIRVVAPFMKLCKSDVLAMAWGRGIVGTYSCHSGKKQPCGVCVSCVEVRSAMEEVS